MRNESKIHIARSIEIHYKTKVDSLARIYKGMGTRNWLLCTLEGRFFVKEYHGTSDIQEAEDALELSKYAYQSGIPTPKIIETHSGNLLCVDGDLAFALFEHISGTTPDGALSVDQMSEAGRILGNIHHHFKRVKTSRTPITTEWLNFDESKKRQEIDGYLKVIEHKEIQDDFDEKTYELLIKRKELLREIPEILNRVSDLTTQVIHNDYSTKNLMFKGAELTGVIDFNPPNPFLVSYEIGRIALPPENLSLPDWKEKAIVLVEQYCNENEVNLKDIVFAPHIWLAQLIGSTYGVKQHYTDPLELQSELDSFWFQRADAAGIILKEIENLEKIFEEIWQRTSRRHIGRSISLPPDSRAADEEVSSPTCSKS